MAANSQTMRAPAAVASTVRPAAARPQPFKLAGTSALKPAAFSRVLASKALRAGRAAGASVVVVRAAKDGQTVVIGLAADSGCGKSTFMRRVTGIFGGESKPPAGGNPDSNTLLSEMTTVICLDDYHCHDRNGRKLAKVTALAPEAQNFDLMYEQVRAEGGVRRER